MASALQVVLALGMADSAVQASVDESQEQPTSRGGPVMAFPLQRPSTQRRTRSQSRSQLYMQRRAPRIDPAIILPHLGFFDCWIVAVRQALWKECAPTRGKRYGVMRHPIAVRHIPSSLGIALMMYYAHHYAGSVHAVKRVESGSDIAYEVNIEQPQKVTAFCSFEMIGMLTKGWGNVRVESKKGDLRVVGGFVLVRYVMGNNHNLHRSASRVGLEFNTWKINGATTTICTGMQLYYPSDIFNGHKKQLKHVLRTWPRASSTFLSDQLKAWSLDDDA